MTALATRPHPVAHRLHKRSLGPSQRTAPVVGALWYRPTVPGSAGPGRRGTVLGALRIASGVAFMALSPPVGRLLISSDADSAGAALFIRAFGARDALLGAGVLLAGQTRRSQCQWLVACGLADGFDAVATLAGYRHLPPRRRALTFVVSAVPAVLNLTTAWELDFSSHLAPEREGVERL